MSKNELMSDDKCGLPRKLKGQVPVPRVHKNTTPECAHEVPDNFDERNGLMVCNACGEELGWL